MVWQVKIDDGKATLDEDPIKPNDLKGQRTSNEWEKWIERWQPSHRGCLKARVNRPEDSNDPCLTAPDAKYRGQENQLYRVEIHQGGSAVGGATFKWSKDNGSIVSRVVEKCSDTELMVEKPLGFSAGNWVELSNDGQELWGLPGQLVKLLKVDGDRFTLESNVVPIGDDLWPTKVRRWDQGKKSSPELNKGAVPVKEGQGQEIADWIELENGIQIQFLPSGDENNKHSYRTGDYWLIPARVATGSIEWPLDLDLDDEGKPKLVDGKENPIPRAPFGIQHHYAPLAIIKSDGNVDDRRSDFPTGSQIPSAGEVGKGGHPKCDESPG